MDVIVGTAGHIDHGKTALIRALTGVDTDRLPEEKQRGITIDLGFAELTFGDTHFGFIDVPGHERFVKNMLAGASGIDLVLLVVAANEGVMPQTREHFDICRLLGVDQGIIVLTKSDLADAETIDFTKLDVAELVADTPFESAPVISVSSRTGDGIAELRDALVQISSGVHVRTGDLITRLPIDRSFSVNGFGTVVTGTLASGRINEGADLVLTPNVAKVRVRGIQVHGKSVETALPGQRVAVNLGGIDHAKVERGMVLTEPAILQPTQVIDAEIEVLPGAAGSLRSRQRVRIHLGTIEALARIQVLNHSGEIERGEQGFVQIRLEVPIVAVPRERFILRSYSPQITIAGGSVLDNAATKHRRKDLASVCGHLSALKYTVEPIQYVRTLLANAGGSGLRFSDLQALSALQKDVLTSALTEDIASRHIFDCGGVYITSTEFDSLCSRAISAVENFHKVERLAKGMPREALRESIFAFLPSEIFQGVITSLEIAGEIITDKESVRIAEHQAILSPAETLLRKELLSIYMDAGLEVPKSDEALIKAANAAKLDTHTARKLFAQFLDSGEIVKVTDEFYFEKSVIAYLIEKLRKHAATGNKTIEVAQFKALAGVSRKYAIPLLEYFDRTHVTARSGDKRIIL